VDEREKSWAKAELARFIDDQLREFVVKTFGIQSSPAWVWSIGLEAFPPYYDTTKKTIVLPEFIYVQGYLIDPDATKRALRWVLGHEYWHYVQHQRGEWVRGAGIFAGPTLEERVAVTRASILTGISNMEGLILTEHVLEAIIEKKVDEIGEKRWPYARFEEMFSY